MAKTFDYQKLTVLLFILLPLAVTAGIFFSGDRAVSVNENRALTTRGEISSDVLGGEFQTTLEQYLSDQFPGRDWLKHTEVEWKLTFGAQEIGGAYIGRDYRLFQRLREADVDRKACLRYAARINRLAEETGIPTYALYVPSAGTALPDSLPKGAPMYDYDKLYAKLLAAEKSVIPVNVRPVLTEEGDYYATDHHWTAQGAWKAYGVWREAHGEEAAEAPEAERFTVDEQFRGTLYSRVPSARIPCDVIQAPAVGDDLTVEADGQEISFYDERALDGKDKYNFFQGGNHGILTVVNPDNPHGKSLLILKDSFANSLLPYLVDDYAKITMLDERYAFIDAQQMALTCGMNGAPVDEIAVIREIISVP